MHKSFHLTFTAPNKVMPHWSQGFWALYEINGDEIASRIIKDGSGKIVERHPWCGFVSGFGSLEEATAAIAERTKS